ncbi:hypothetical protein [Bacillus mycoides]|uniref:hypothetical protein n=1 Tax=Bacillus mycoides TaxID=1405 RepID=UPI000B4C19B6|nr:hypothetical protein [Bacillus mycoides]
MDNNNNQFVFHTIKSSAIKKFVIIDLITGTGIYWTVNFISSSALLAIISCVLGTKKIKKNATVLKLQTKIYLTKMKFL